jgi:hypothetical protein
MPGSRSPSRPAAGHHRQQLQRVGRPVGCPRRLEASSASPSRRRRRHPWQGHGGRRLRGDRLGLRPAAGPGDRRAVAGLPGDGQAARDQEGDRAENPRASCTCRPTRATHLRRDGPHRHRDLGGREQGARHHEGQARAASSPTWLARWTCPPRTSPNVPTSSSSSPGEIELPGDVHMRDIGLPTGVAYACLAETVVLALEGRYETFTVGRAIEWEKVKEIYQLGLKHGMKLATISGSRRVHRRGLRPGPRGRPGRSCGRRGTDSATRADEADAIPAGEYDEPCPACGARSDAGPRCLTRTGRPTRTHAGRNATQHTSA